jgi:hypothetical protein
MTDVEEQADRKNARKAIRRWKETNFLFIPPAIHKINSFCPVRQAEHPALYE